jgi:dTDP-L-rhamnose 4-epimerase
LIKKILKNKKILITGGAGFIGQRLCKILKLEGAIVRIVDNLSPQIHGKDAKFIETGIDFIKADITDFDSMLNAVTDVDFVIHLAAETGTGQSMYEVSRYVKVNELGTAILLQAILEAKIKPKIILASSRSVYGEGSYIDKSGNIFTPPIRNIDDLKKKRWEHKDDDGELITCVSTKEDAKLDPGSIYAATKLNQETLITTFAAANNIPTCILRLQNVYGEEQSLQNPYTGIISIFYNRIRQKLSIEIFEDGLETRDFVHRDDVVNAFRLSLINQRKLIDVINIGTGQPTTVLDLAKIMFRVLKLKYDFKIVEKFRIGDIRHNYADIERARSILGYTPNVTLEKGLVNFISWAETQPAYKDKSSKAISELAAYYNLSDE